MAGLIEQAQSFLSGWGQPAYRRRLQEERAAVMAFHEISAQLHTANDPTVAQKATGGRHPILQLTERMHPAGHKHQAQLTVFHAMRHYVPTLDAAIRNRRALEGTIFVTSDDEGLAGALNDWIEDVSVGYLADNASLRGLNTYLNMLSGSADEYGLAAGEIQTDERGTEVERLVVPDSQTLSLEDRDQDDRYELYQQQKSGPRRLDNEPLVQTLAFRHSTAGPWPRPMAWSLIKSTEILLRMFESVINGWARFGDPSTLNAIEYTDAESQPDIITVGTGDDQQQVPRALLLFKNSVEQVMQAKRHGGAGDVYAFTDAGGQIKSEVLGDIDQSLMKWVKEHRSTFAGDIIAQSETPVWMYPSFEMSGDGLGTARSNNQAMMCAVAARKRGEKKAALAKEVLDTFLLLSGDGRYIGQYEIDFDVVSIIDDKAIAEADKTRAEADATIIENSFQLFNSGAETSGDGSMRITDEQRQYLEERGVL